MLRARASRGGLRTEVRLSVEVQQTGSSEVVFVLVFLPPQQSCSKKTKVAIFRHSTTCRYPISIPVPTKSTATYVPYSSMISFNKIPPHTKDRFTSPR